MTDLLKRVYALMDERGIKPTQLTRELGMSISTFTDWGKGSPSLKAVIQFSKYFNVSLDYLVFGKTKTIVQTVTLDEEDDTLLESVHALTPDLRIKLNGYIDALLDEVTVANSEQEKLSS